MEALGSQVPPALPVLATWDPATETTPPLAGSRTLQVLRAIDKRGLLKIASKACGFCSTLYIILTLFFLMIFPFLFAMLATSFPPLASDLIFVLWREKL